LYPAIVTPELLGEFQDRSMWCVLAVPLSPIVTFGFVAELLEIASCPVELPTMLGLNVSVRLTD